MWAEIHRTGRPRLLPMPDPSRTGTTTNRRSLYKAPFCPSAVSYGREQGEGSRRRRGAGVFPRPSRRPRPASRKLTMQREVESRRPCAGVPTSAGSETDGPDRGISAREPANLAGYTVDRLPRSCRTCRADADLLLFASAAGAAPRGGAKGRKSVRLVLPLPTFVSAHKINDTTQKRHRYSPL